MIRKRVYIATLGPTACVASTLIHIGLFLTQLLAYYFYVYFFTHLPIDDDKLLPWIMSVTFQAVKDLNWCSLCCLTPLLIWKLGLIMMLLKRCSTSGKPWDSIHALLKKWNKLLAYIVKPWCLQGSFAVTLDKCLLSYFLVNNWSLDVNSAFRRFIVTFITCG